MNDADPRGDLPRGRLVLVTGRRADARAAVAKALARSLDRAVLLDPDVFDAMVVSAALTG